MAGINEKLYAYGLRKQVKLGEFPVISVGNVSFGGNGKTPMVEYIVNFFTKHNKRPCILTRGYGNDEVRCLKLKFPEMPIGVGADRIKSFKNFTCKIDVVVLDDGLQHFPIKRDIDIAMINAVAGMNDSYGSCLPLGTLREPYQAALQRVHCVILHNYDLVNSVHISEMENSILEIKNVPIFHSKMNPKFIVRASEYASGSAKSVALDIKNACIFCGIGNSEQLRRSFCKHVNSAQATIHMVDYPDHHVFSKQEMEELITKFDSDVVFVTTEKDFARSPSTILEILGERCYILGSELQVIEKEEFEKQLLSI